MTASGSPGQAATVGTADALVEAAAKALWYDGSPLRGYDFALLRRDTQDAYRADARRTLAAVLPLLADEIEAHQAETERGAPRFAVGNATFNEGVVASSAILRDLAVLVAR